MTYVYIHMSYIYQAYSGICYTILGTLCLINKLESIQRRAACFVMSDYYSTNSVSTMLHRLEWNTVQSQNKVLNLVLFYKIIY